MSSSPCCPPPSNVQRSEPARAWQLRSPTSDHPRTRPRGCRSASRSEQRPPARATCPTPCLSAPTKRCCTPNTAPARHADQNARTRQARTPDRTSITCCARATMMSSDRSRDQTPGRPPPAGPARPSRELPDEHALLHELWQISHFGWVAHATMLRSLTVTAGHHTADGALAGHLQQLRDRGWVQQRSSAAHAGQREWRLTDSGRNAVRED